MTSTGGISTVDLTTSDFVIRKPSDVLDLLGAGLHRVVLQDRQLPAEFFDLSSGFAGELVQKCNNYGIRIAIVGQHEEGRSTSFRQFAQESNRGNRFVFVDTIDDALKRLSSGQGV